MKRRPATIRVLLIEDNLEDARQVRDMLEGGGEGSSYEVVHKRRLQEADAFIDTADGVDVIISDVNLPDSTSTETLARLQEVAEDTPVIFTTGASEDLATLAIQRGAQDYLIKGQFDSRLLIRSIRYAIERKKIERSLLRAEEQLRAVTDNADSTLLLLNEKGLTVFANPAAELITGYTLDELKNQSPHDLLHHHHQNGKPYPPEDCPTVKAYWDKKPIRGEDLYIRKDGSFFPVRFSMSPIIRGGIMTGSVLEFQDISDQKNLERQKDDFIGIASHELKTPVTSIKAYAQVLGLRFKRAGDTASMEMIGKMDAQLNKLTYLISDLLDVTKIESGKLLFHKSYFDINALIEEIVEEVQHTTRRHTILLDLAITRKIYGDRYRIGQVITNLVTNAIKYSPHSDKITVRSLLHPKSVIISVQDFGVGIPPEKQAKVFERFYRVGGPTQETYSGLGLGLYISSEIVKRHHGRIWLESTAGKGSTFYFELPVKYKPKVARRPAESEEADEG